VQEGADRLRFSVIIPLYNKQRFIARAVSSVLAQDWQDFEVLVIDDGSTDGGPQVVRDRFRDSRIRLIEQKNAGAGAARNCGLATAQGEAAAFLDADDEWLPTHLSDLMAAASMYPEAALQTTGFRSVYRGDRAVDYSIDSRSPSLIPDYYRFAVRGHSVHISSFAVTGSVLAEGPRFSEYAPVLEDEEFYARTALQSPIAYHPRISSIYHHDDEASIIATAGVLPGMPLTAQTISRMLAESTVPAGKRESASTYLGWIVEQHALAWLAIGKTSEALSLLREAQLHPIVERYRGRLGYLRLIAQCTPKQLLSLAIRYGRSRWHLPVAEVLSRLSALTSSSSVARPLVRSNKNLLTSSASILR